MVRPEIINALHSALPISGRLSDYDRDGDDSLWRRPKKSNPPIPRHSNKSVPGSGVCTMNSCGGLNGHTLPEYPLQVIGSAELMTGV